MRILLLLVLVSGTAYARQVRCLVDPGRSVTCWAVTAPACMPSRDLAGGVFDGSDKAAHIAAGAAISLLTANLLEKHFERVDGEPLSQLERAWFGVLAGFVAAAFKEGLDGFAGNGIDPDDIGATTIGAVGGSLLYLTFDL